MFVTIPLTSLPWTEPRGQIRWLKPSAKQFGKPVRKWEQEYLQPFKAPHPVLGQRVWHIPMHEATPVEELLTHLVVMAQKQFFPISIEDQQIMSQWVQHIDQKKLRYLDAGESQQMSTDVVGEVFEGLVKRFDLPATPWALQDYIKETALGLKRDEMKKSNPYIAEPYIDPTSGVRMYPDSWVARDVGCHEKKVARWREKHGITIKGLSEEQLGVLKQEQCQKGQRKAIMDYLVNEKGKTTDAAKKWIQRHLARGENFEAMAKALLPSDRVEG